MTHSKIAPVMGCLMDAMIPAMAHGPISGAGLAFVAAHLAAALILAAAVMFLPRARVFVARHRPDRRMLGAMAAGGVAGFALICTHCLVTWHGSA